MAISICPPDREVLSAAGFKAWAVVAAAVLLGVGGRTAHAADWQFRFPQIRGFISSSSPARPAPQDLSDSDWLAVHPSLQPDQTWYFGSRVVVELMAGVDAESLPDLSGLTLERTTRPGLFIVQTGGPLDAARLAERLSRTVGVRVAYPIHRRPAEMDFAFAPAPNDGFFEPQVANVAGQWYLENRNPTNGVPLGVDLNARGAWPLGRGAGVTIAIADVGVELSHRDLVDRTFGAPHFNFLTNMADGLPTTRLGMAGAHGTACAGLAVATADNDMAMSGMAPEAGLASWVIIDHRGILASDERLAQMFTYSMNAVGIQNHSWGVPSKRQDGPAALEDAAIGEAFSRGRSGKGVVMVRAAGNQRAAGQNSNDDSYANDWRAICVAAISGDGRATPYSEPGACLLVAAPGGSTSDSGLFTTDLKGGAGANIFGFLPPYEYLSDYMFNSIGFIGTSAAAPLVSGIAAILLGINPGLAVRDVQQILLLSARQFDQDDPDLAPNGAGLYSSHNTGFGVVDAGEAARLAKRWVNRPSAEIHIIPPDEVARPIPDDGLRGVLTGDSIPPELESIRTVPGTGPFADDPTRALPLVAAGPSAGGPVLNLTNLGAIMELEPGRVAEQIQYAGAMGAEFVLIYNCTVDGVNPCPLTSGPPLNGTDYTPIPAVFIGRTNALSLLALLGTNATARASIRLSSAEHFFAVTNTLLLEHVRLRIRTDHTIRGDLRVTLVSPSGTRSVMQRLNDDTTPGPTDWTYMSTRHFFEPSRGVWKVAVSDLFETETGSVHYCGLILHGVPILDSDDDGLDDGWEVANFQGLQHGPAERLVSDPYSLVHKFVSGMSPAAPAHPFVLEIVPWNHRLIRVSWPGLQGEDRVFGGDDPGRLMALGPAAPTFWESVWLAPITHRGLFFQVKRP